jgi:hypothetical protein
MANSFLAGVAGDSQRKQFRLFNNALFLDGINDYVRLDYLTAPAAYQAFWPENNFTISAWVKNPSLRPFPHIITCSFQNATGASPDVIQIFFGTPYIGYQAVNFTSGIATATFRVFCAASVGNNWSHIVFTGEIGTGQDRIKIYQNGRLLTPSLVANQTLTKRYTQFDPSNAAYSKPTIGVTPSGTTANFDSYLITDFLYSAKTATPSEVRRLFNYGSNTSFANYPTSLIPQLHLPLGEVGQFTTGSPLLANDISGNLRNCTVLGQGTIPTLNAFY